MNSHDNDEMSYEMGPLEFILDSILSFGVVVVFCMVMYSLYTIVAY